MLTKDRSKVFSRQIKTLLSFRIEKLRTHLMTKKDENNINDDAFEKLAVYCFEHLLIPKTHKDYIGENLMSREMYKEGFNSEIAIDFITSKKYKKVHGNNLEFPLRSVEALIDYNEEELSYNQIYDILEFIFNFYELKR